MKRSNKILSILIAVATSLTLACETEKIVFDGPYFVRFSKTTITEKESRIPTLKIEVHNAGPAPKRDITINYTIGGSAREGIDYTIVGKRGEVEIESGEYFGYIELKMINNSNNILRSQDVILTLQTVEDNSEKLYLGQGASQIGQSCTITIQDDCILGGNYYGVRTAASVPTEGITITSLNCEDYTLSNWDISIFNFPDLRDLTFIDNGDNTLTIPPQEDDTLPEELATIDGSGVVNPATRVITFTIRLVDFEEQPTFTFNLMPN